MDINRQNPLVPPHDAVVADAAGTSVFFVTTGFQLLSAVEARHKMMHVGSCRLLIPKALAGRCEPLLVDWDSIQLLPDRHPMDTRRLALRWSRARSARSLAKLHERPLRVFLGSDGEVTRAVASNARADSLILLDDGTATLTSSLVNPSRIGRTVSQGRLKEFSKAALYGTRKLTVKYDAIFTMFDFPSEHPAAGKVVPNAFDWTRRRMFEQTRERVFLGSPLVEKGMMSRQAYLWAVCKAIEEDNLNVYLPHPGELRDRALFGALERRGVRVRDNSSFFELDCIERKSVPEHVASFASTASFSFAAMGYRHATTMYWTNAISSALNTEILVSYAARNDMRLVLLD